MEKKAPAQSFEALMVWQKAHQFMLSTYKCTFEFPREEIYALPSPFGRAAISIAANIAK
jgi:four helix bundle protein